MSTFYLFKLLCVFLLLIGLIKGHGITEKAAPQPEYLQVSQSMESCCSLVNSTWPQLMKCVNASAIRHEKVFGESAKIGIVTFATHDIWNYTAFSYGVNQIYAENNGYIFRHIDDSSAGSESLDPRDSRWNKVKILEEALDTWGKGLDYVVWVDADIVVLDMGLKIEDVVEAHPRAHIFSSAEHAGSSTLINSGMLIAKNSVFTRTFLRAWWGYGDRSLYSDQEQFDLLYKHCEDRWHGVAKGTIGSSSKAESLALLRDAPFDVTENIAILPPDALNSDPPAMTRQRPQNQILHLMGEHTAYRAHVFQAGLVELCHMLHSQSGDLSMIAPRHVLAPQLTLTQPNLLQWTVEIYGSEVTEIMREYAAGAPYGEYGIPESRRLSNAVHHFAHAIDYSNANRDNEGLRGGSNISTRQLRRSVWELLLENIVSRRDTHSQSERSHRVDSDWPELLKIVAEAGQQLVSLSSMPFAERQEISERVMLLLEEILRVCHKQQQPAVLHMVAHMHSETGMLQYQQGLGHESLEHFHLSLQIYRDLSVHTGKHILVQPLTNLANALSTQKYFPQAFPLFEEAIQEAENVLGLRHESIANHYVNFGISKLQWGAYAEASVLLRKALHIFDANDADMSAEPCRKARMFLAAAKRKDSLIDGL